jgi:hypothetical protein
MAGVTSKARTPAVSRPSAKYIAAWIKDSLQSARRKGSSALPHKSARLQ